MTTLATNYLIGPSDGWVSVAPTASKFLRISAFPHTHPFYLSFGSSAPSLVALAGSGTVTFATGVPTANQTITVGSETYTFKASRVNPFEVTIGADFHASATNFTAAVNADSKLVKAVDVADVITLTAIAVGTQGNYGLATNATNVTVSGVAFTGGADIPLGILVCHKPYWSNVTTDAKCWARVVNPAIDKPKGVIRLDVVTIV